MSSNKTRKRSARINANTASSSSVFDLESEEETSSSSAAATSGRNGKAPRRSATLAAPTLPSRPEEDDLSDGDEADASRGDITIREVFQLLQTQSTQLRAL